jgi:hypothetical protein
VQKPPFGLSAQYIIPEIELFRLVYELDFPSLNGQTVMTLHVKAGLQAHRFIYFPEERKEVIVGSMRRYTPSFIHHRKTGLW